MLQRDIPSTKEQLPVIGLGTWQTFDTSDSNSFPPLREVLNTVIEAGTRLIDSSPMYGHAEQVVGELTYSLPNRDELFYATKVWTTGKKEGIAQMQDSFKKMKREQMDLLQIHNLVDWKTHLKTLREWKSQGLVRYIGITHYTDAMHDELERVIRSEEIDFVQFNYSIFSRNAEKSLLKTAADHGVATLINRPFGEGSAFARVKGQALPGWVRDYGITSWSQYFLLYIIAHPAVTCVIPATADPAHAKENVLFPAIEMDERLQAKMRDAIKSIL